MTRAALIAAASAQWVRTPVARVDLLLPLPISTNDLWAPGKKGLRLSKQYARWKVDAGRMLEIQRPGRIVGKYSITLLVCGGWGGDLDNAIKATNDLLETHGVVSNDRLGAPILMDWSDHVEGMSVTLKSVASITQLTGA